MSVDQSIYSPVHIILSGHSFMSILGIWIIFHTIVARVCHDIDSRSYFQGQCHCTVHTKSESMSGHTSNSLLPGWIWIILQTVVVHGCVMTSSFKVISPRSTTMHT